MEREMADSATVRNKRLRARKREGDQFAKVTVPKAAIDWLCDNGYLSSPKPPGPELGQAVTTYLISSIGAEI
jgi:hypothetical protein